MRAGLSQLRPFGAQRGDGVALARDLAAQLGDALGPQRRLELDLVDIGGRQHQRDQDADVEKAHRRQRPLSTSASDGSRGSSSAASLRGRRIGALGGTQLGRARARIARRSRLRPAPPGAW